MALFARAPMPGKVKTRLVGGYSAEEVCSLHRAFVLDSWEKLASFRQRSEIFLYSDHPCREWADLAGDHLRLQANTDLGDRMLQCFNQMSAGGFGPLLILGSDSPGLPISYLLPWTDLLSRYPALLGPAEDGGYYGVGCRAPHPEMFAGVEWSGPQTLSQTEAALRRCGLVPDHLAMYYDVDTPADLARLAREQPRDSHASRWISGHPARSAL